MSYYEYRVVPAPKEAPRAKGVKTTADRFALGLEEALNVEGRDAWEYQRSETLTVFAKQGLFRRPVQEIVTVMIYRRWVDTVEDAPGIGASGTAPFDLPRDEPHVPEDLAAELTDATREHDAAVQTDAPQSATRKDRALSAQRHTEGALRPVPGPNRD